VWAFDLDVGDVGLGPRPVLISADVDIHAALLGTCASIRHRRLCTDRAGPPIGAPALAAAACQVLSVCAADSPLTTCAVATATGQDVSTEAIWDTSPLLSPRRDALHSRVPLV